MATSNHTENYNLSQYAAGDPVKFLTNYNGDMAAIDAALKAISDSDAGKVPATRAVLGLPLSADITLAQFIAAGLAPGDNICRPNLLTDGNIQIWQEAENFTGLTGNRYTATMWQTWPGTEASYSVQKAGACGGILVKNDSADAINVSLVALVEKGTIKPSTTYTIAAKGTRNGALFTAYLAKYGESPFANKILTEADPSFSFTTPSTLDSHFFASIEIGNLAAGATAEIDSVKLEEGDRFTGFYTEQYADVFVQTQRYYQRGFTGRCLSLASPYTTKVAIFIPLFLPMRIVPTASVISGADTTLCIGENWGNDFTPTDLAVQASASGGFILSFTNAVLDHQYFLKTDVIQADARL